MQKQPPSSFCAAAAIAAALALGSTAAQAQDAGLAPDVPTIAPPAPPAAAPAPAAQISTPVVQAVPAATAPEPVTAARAAPKTQPATARPATRNTTPRAAASTAASAPIAPVAAVIPAAVVIPPAAAPAPVTPLDPAPRAEAGPPAQVQPEPNGLGGGEAGLIALLAAGGLAGAGFMVARSRRKRDEDEIAETVTDRAALAPAVPVPTPERVAPRQPEPATERFAMPAGPIPAMPAGQVPSGTEREALLQRMVAAAPDEANPFTSSRSRRKRARLILQHGAHLQEAQGAEPFDWRTYLSTETDPRVKETPVPA